jgi:hypothetical protein
VRKERLCIFEFAIEEYPGWAVEDDEKSLSITDP